MKTILIATVHLIELDNPIADKYDIDAMSGETTSTNPFMQAVSDIEGVISIAHHHDFTNRCGLFITVNIDYDFEEIKKRIRVLNGN